MPKALSRSGRGRSLLLCNGMSWRQRWSRGEEICGGHHVSHGSLPRMSRVGSKGQTMHTREEKQHLRQHTWAVSTDHRHCWAPGVPLHWGVNSLFPPNWTGVRFSWPKPSKITIYRSALSFCRVFFVYFGLVVWVFCVCLFCIALSPLLIQMLALNLF